MQLLGASSRIAEEDEEDKKRDSVVSCSCQARRPGFQRSERLEVRVESKEARTKTRQFLAVIRHIVQDLKGRGKMKGTMQISSGILRRNRKETLCNYQVCRQRGG